MAAWKENFWHIVNKIALFPSGYHMWDPFDRTFGSWGSTWPWPTCHLGARGLAGWRRKRTVPCAWCSPWPVSSPRSSIGEQWAPKAILAAFSFSVYGVLASLKCLASNFDVIVPHTSSGQVTRFKLYDGRCPYCWRRDGKDDRGDPSQIPKSEINRNTPSARSIAFNRILDFVNQSHRLVLGRHTSDSAKSFESTLMSLFPLELEYFLRKFRQGWFFAQFEL